MHGSETPPWRSSAPAISSAPRSRKDSPPKDLQSSPAGATPTNLRRWSPISKSAGGGIVARGLDARKEEEVTAFLRAADAHAPLEVCVFNIGANVNFPLLDTTERVFRKVWELACYAGFLTGREAARLMLPRGKGCIFFTGATASVRGGIGYAAFASAKSGLRAVAQSMARELGPKNIHVAHLIIDAGVDTAFVRERIKQQAGRAGARDSLEPDQLDESGIGRRSLLAALPAAPRRLDVRTRLASLSGDLVKWPRWNFSSISAARTPISPIWSFRRSSGARAQNSSTCRSCSAACSS